MAPGANGIDEIAITRAFDPIKANGDFWTEGPRKVGGKLSEIKIVGQIPLSAFRGRDVGVLCSEVREIRQFRETLSRQWKEFSLNLLPD